jgi:hypothetical protein
MLTYGVVLLHVNALPHTAAPTRALLKHFNWELFDHPPYSPGHAPNDYHLFPHPKNWLGSERFNNTELTEGVKTWPNSQAADFIDAHLQKLIPRYEKCLNSAFDCVEKWLKYVRIFLHVINFFLIACFVISSPEVNFRTAVVH